ncbi:MAG: trypsin-like peptidase domain-containing protein [Deltaproteobacteria bacterium]
MGGRPERALARVGRVALTALALAFAAARPARASEAVPVRVAGMLPDLRAIARNALPSVVAIAVEQPSGEAPADPLHEPLDRTAHPALRRGLGTGFIIRPEGYILTNSHVIEGAVHIEVAMGAGSALRHYVAHVVGQDEATDLAILKIETDRPLPCLSFGDSDRLEVAQWVVAIGNPFGLSRTVTAGIVSQLGREDVSPQGRHGYFDFIQTDAPINPGSSGGPLLDLHGHVIGIANAVHSSGQGIAFAIPINMAKAVLPQLLRNGKVTRGWIGINVERLPGEARRLLGVRDSAGVLVSDVVPGSPAEKAGLRIGDLLLAFDGRYVDDPKRIRWWVATSGIGRTVRIRLLRAGRPLLCRVRLAELPETEPPRALPPIPGLGIAVADDGAPGPFQEAFAGEGARVVSVDPQGPGFAAGLREGDLVAGVNGHRIHSPAGLLAATTGLPTGASVKVWVRHPSGGIAMLSIAKGTLGRMIPASTVRPRPHHLGLPLP